MKYYVTRKHLVWVILALCACIYAMAAHGCGRAKAPSIPIRGANTLLEMLPEAPPLKEGESILSQAENNRAFWDARIAVEKDKAKRDREEERNKWLDRICRAVILICFVGVLGNVALFVASFLWAWFAKLRIIALAGIISNFAIIAIVWFLPVYIGWVAGAIVLGAGITVIYLIRNMHGLGCEVHKARKSASDAVTALVKKVG